jgi:YHS domain-containing protein
MRSNIMPLIVVGCIALAGCGTPYATVPNKQGEPVMLLGHDPVSYFTKGKPERGFAEFKASLENRTYYFSNAVQRQTFLANPARYEPQYGGFCASGAAYALKLSSDPTAWTIYQGRLFIFGDILGKTAWELDPAWNVGHGDALWPESAPNGWRYQTLKRYANKVPHYKDSAQILREYQAKYPDKPWPSYDVGNLFTSIFLKLPGWRAAEGFSQPALGYPE